MRTMSGDPCLHYDCTNRNSFGYCKTTACINSKYSNIGTAQYGQGVQKRIITNQEAMSELTPEEFYRRMYWLMFQYGCQFNNTELAVIEWLKEEAK